MQVALRVEHHVAREVESDDSAAGQTLQQQVSEPSGSATGVEDTLIAAQVQVAEDALSPLELGRGEAMVLGGVPLAKGGLSVHFSAGNRSFTKLILMDNGV